VLRLGEPPASKTLGAWLAEAGADEVVLRCAGRWIDPARRATLVVDAPVTDLCVGLASLAAPAPDGWATRWVSTGRRASAALDVALARHAEPTGPGIARALLAGLPERAALVVSSSLPVRELEWFAVPRATVSVHANRGANGIDGVVSTVVGVAVATARVGAPTVGLLGDLALLHDTNGLAGVAAAGLDLVLVVVDNDGGGIFSFLPQHGDLPAERFEQLFGTPHGIDLALLAAAHGAVTHLAESTAEVLAAVAVAQAAGGLHVVVARTDRGANVALHEELFAAVADTVASGP
jgi:2-succinyl-5-enolpyruvyl-6-hydroxy-3-cyclohexene-1-carboxylate synthase